MRRQWPCSKCGFTCSSTWRSWYPSKPVVCSACVSKQNNVVIAHANPPRMQTEMYNIDQEARFVLDDNHDRKSSSPASIDMIFGKLPFEPLSIPVNVLDCGNESLLQDLKLKSEVDKEKHCQIRFRDHFHCGSSSLKTSTGHVLESDCRQTLLGNQSFSVWDPNKVQKRRRSKLHQYTLSPLARLLRQLHQVYRSNINKISKLNRGKYDDDLIYEKCKYVCENEIGLGAKILSQSIVHFSKRERFYEPVYTYAYSTESSSASESGAHSSCLIDVPVRCSCDI